MSWTKVARWLGLHALVATTFLWQPVFDWTSILWLSLTMVLVSCVGVSVGMHRGLIHRSFTMRPAFRRAVMYLACHAGMGGPSAFVRMHEERDFHQDQPTSPAIFGYQVNPLVSYVQQVFCIYVGPPVPRTHPELENPDAWVRFLDRFYLLVPVPWYGLLWLVGGWNALFWGGLFPWVIGQNMFWLSNYIVHTSGYQNFARPGHAEQGYNNYLIGLASFGEGFHNNHHEFPRSARMGLFRGEVDIGWWFVRLFERLGWVSDIRVATNPQRRPSVSPPA